MQFQGSIPALITPMRDGVIDEAVLRKLIDWHVEQGSHGLVPVGTTGESPTLSHEEHRRVVEIAIEHCAGRIPIIAGAGSNSTAEAVDFTRHAHQAGADAVLVVAPYYNKPNAHGLYQHFKAVALCANIPIFIYNVPSRTGIDISVQTVTDLADSFANIIGVKDATSEIDRVTKQRIASGESFIQLSGEDGTALGFNAHGGCGCISVTANVAPALCAQFQDSCLKGDYASARRIHDRLMPLHAALFAEPSPAPVKYAASLLGLCRDETRLPLVPVQEKTQALIRQAMRHAGLIN